MHGLSAAAYVSPPKYLCLFLITAGAWIRRTRRGIAIRKLHIQADSPDRFPTKPRTPNERINHLSQSMDVYHRKDTAKSLSIDGTIRFTFTFERPGRTLRCHLVSLSPGNRVEVGEPAVLHACSRLLATRAASANPTSARPMLSEARVLVK